MHISILFQGETVQLITVILFVILTYAACSEELLEVMKYSALMRNWTSRAKYWCSLTRHERFCTGKTCHCNPSFIIIIIIFVYLCAFKTNKTRHKSFFFFLFFLIVSSWTILLLSTFQVRSLSLKTNSSFTPLPSPPPPPICLRQSRVIKI